MDYFEKLLIVLVIVGLALFFGAEYLWPQAQIPGPVIAANQKVVIDSYNPRAVSVRNVGTASIPVSDLVVLVGGDARRCDWVSDVVSIEPGTLRRCSFSGAECRGGQTIKVIAPGNTVEISC